MTDLPTHGLFLDFETEGLDLATDLPLEVAAMLVNLYTLEQVGNTVEVLIPLPPGTYLERIRAWDPAVRAMHTASGLLTAVVLAEPDHEGAVTGSTGTADRLVSDLLDERLPSNASVPLMGYGVSHMEDRGWVQKHMPKVASRLTYWQLDVSGQRRMLQAFGLDPGDKGGDHRALYDIHAAHEELRNLKSMFLAPEPLTKVMGLLPEPPYEEPF